MNEWKEFDLDNLQKDIFISGLYEFKLRLNTTSPEVYHSRCDKREILNMIAKVEYYASDLWYRKPEPKIPSHQEIINKWWLCDGDWQKVTGYQKNTKEYFKGEDWNKKEWFIGRESSVIPPEEK